MTTHPDYASTVRYLYEALPMFQRVGAVAYKKDIANTIALCDALDNPQRRFKCIHIAGTNGKGSSSHMIAAILQSAGYKTGLYTSPHLKEFTERIKINGEDVSQAFVVDFVKRIRPHIETIQPSFFEITVAMAFDYFAHEAVDFAVIEVGLGGRLDSTNVITPLVSLITNISYDHKDILGDTLQEIAAEKAGIIKPHVPAVISQYQQEVIDVFRERAASVHAPLTIASESLTYDGERVVQDGVVRFERLDCELKGSYQKYNVPGVLRTVDILKEAGITIRESAIRSGIEKVSTLTGLKGRWQKLGERPAIIADTGHNEAGITEIVGQLAQQRFRKLHIVIGMVKDKDILPVLHILPKHADYYFCQAKLPRAMDASALAAKAAEAGLHGRVVADVNDALNAARAAATADDLIFIGGSTFVVAEVEGL